ncbi:MAG: pyrroline-5-carboxylate reductase [Clostridia bacterium]|nr:pyrroline-5-carboxylate reductase [Clostridia bacterium]
MKKLFKLGIIGCGFMAQSILKGVVLSDFLRAKRVVVSDRDEQALDKAADLGVRGTADNRYVAENSEFVLIAVKPQHFEEVARELEGANIEKVISIMAGVKKEKIKALLGRKTKVARCMPNLPCSIGSGVIGVDMSDYNDDVTDTDFIGSTLNCLGTTLSISESKMDAVTGISGSGPAYVFMFIDSLIDAGVKQGLTRNEATVLAVQTVVGSAEMVNESDTPVPELIKRVCSKGGTTIEAVKVLEENNFRGIIGEAVSACTKRSKELSE